MGNQNTTKATLDQMVETNKNMESNTAMKENTYNLDTKQLMTNKKADLVAMNLQYKAENDLLAERIAKLESYVAGNLAETPFELEGTIELTKEQKKARAIARMKATKAKNKAEKLQAEAEANAEPEPEIVVVPESDTKAKQEPADTKTKLTKEERKAISDAKIVHCGCTTCTAWCTGQSTKQTVAEFWANHLKKVSAKLDKQVKAGEITKTTATKRLKLHVQVAGPRS